MANRHIITLVLLCILNGAEGKNPSQKGNCFHQVTVSPSMPSQGDGIVFYYDHHYSIQLPCIFDLRDQIWGSGYGFTHFFKAKDGSNILIAYDPEPINPKSPDRILDTVRLGIKHKDIRKIQGAFKIYATIKLFYDENAKIPTDKYYGFRSMDSGHVFILYMNVPKKRLNDYNYAIGSLRVLGDDK